MSDYLPRDENDTAIQAVRFKDGEAQSVSITGTAARTSADFSAPTNLNSRARIIALWADTATHIKFGSSSVDATTSDFPIPANTLVYLPLDPSDDRVSGIKVTGSDDGNLYVTECL